MISIGIDTGGTFTDIVLKEEKGWKIYKLLSTPHDPSEAVLKGIKECAVEDKEKQIIHGSTVATNTLLERSGAITAIITNKGFEDIIEIGRQDRKELYNLTYRRPACLVHKDNRFGIKGRLLYTGQEYEPLDHEEIKAVIEKIKSSGIESVAVCLLFSYANPAHEIAIGELLKEEGIYFSLSHKIVGEFREYERFSTTVVNSYVGPKMSSYINRLKNGIGKKDILRIMQSNGGSISADLAAEEPVRTILSGPAGGVVGAYEIAKIAGYEKLISFDMGGTSTDVSLIDGGISITTESEIATLPIKVPMIDIHTVGAGGGSIVRLDSGGSLRVGPQSAGADPGPICYGKGDQITVTDANLYLGRLIPDYFLGGEMKLYPERLSKPFYELSKKTGLSPEELAEGIISVANSNMEKAIRKISVERGYDPREFSLFCFGGAGAMHAAYLAKLLSIPRVIVPENPGLLSAIGMLMADVIKDYSVTIMKNQDQIDLSIIKENFSFFEKEGINELKKQGIREDQISVERYLDMRYEGQSYEIIVPFRADFIEMFHKLHEKLYGYKKAYAQVQIVNLRVRIKGNTKKPNIKRYDLWEEKVPDKAFITEREAIFDGKRFTVPVLKRDELIPGNKIKGPAIVVEYSSTTVIPPFAQALIDSYKNMVITLS